MRDQEPKSDDDHDDHDHDYADDVDDDGIDNVCLCARIVCP